MNAFAVLFSLVIVSVVELAISAILNVILIDERPAHS